MSPPAEVSGPLYDVMVEAAAAAGAGEREQERPQKHENIITMIVIVINNLSQHQNTEKRKPHT